MDGSTGHGRAALSRGVMGVPEEKHFPFIQKQRKCHLTRLIH